MLLQFSATHKKRPLCYTQIKTDCLKVVQSTFEFSIPKGCLIKLVAFNFWEKSIICWSVVCSFIDWSYLWNKTFLRYILHIISDPLKTFFSGMLQFSEFLKIEILLTIRVMTSAHLNCRGYFRSPSLISEFYSQITLTLYQQFVLN